MTKRTICAILIAALSFAILTFRPGIWLVDKPADADAHYALGWKDGCISGTNSYSLLYAPLLDKPFIKNMAEANPPSGANTSSGNAKELYKTGWNEGFTLCRYYQSAVYELMQFAIIVSTLLFIGYLLARKKTADR